MSKYLVEFYDNYNLEPLSASDNQPPVVTLSGPTSALVGGTAEFTANPSDADGTVSAVQFTKDDVNYGAPVTSPPWKISVTNLVQGTTKWKVRATDDRGAQSVFSNEITLSVAPAPSNQAPIARISAVSNVQLPTSTTTLNGSTSSDTDGTIASYLWTKESGPTGGTLSANNVAQPSLSALQAGTYVYGLVVTDDKGLASTKATVTFQVLAAANQAPVANAGANKTINLPTNSVQLQGTGTDADGTIASYLWNQVSGPSTATLSSTSQPNITVSNLIAGTYVFGLIVTDNLGLASARATTTVTAVAEAVNQAPTASIKPVSNVQLPTNTATLDGTLSSDPDGTIASYAWRRVSGPAGSSFSNATAATTQVTGLIAGTYVFGLIVTDNKGLASTEATITFQTLAAVVGPPTATLVSATPRVIVPYEAIQVAATGTAASGAQMSRIDFMSSQQTSPFNSVNGTGPNYNGAITADKVGAFDLFVRAFDNQSPAKTGDSGSLRVYVHSYRLKGTGAQNGDGTKITLLNSTVQHALYSDTVPTAASSPAQMRLYIEGVLVANVDFRSNAVDTVEFTFKHDNGTVYRSATGKYATGNVTLTPIT